MNAQTSASAVHNTFVVERSYSQSPERVFAAFAQPSRKRQWYAEGDHDIKEYEMDFKVDGTERFRYAFKEGHPIAGSEILNEGKYYDIVQEERIVMATKMSLNGKSILMALVTIEFMRSETGTNLVLTNQGTFLDWEGGPQMIEAGWRGLLERLRGYLEK
jgi:uncharacterized protein YndB with AHSA1/START domain